MHWSLLPSLALLSLTIATQTFLPSEECPLLGPTFSTDFDLSQSPEFLKAKEGFPDVIQKLIEAGEISNTTSFVIDVYSTRTNTSLYTYTNKAANPLVNETYTSGELNDETIFRIGSVSKLFTVYAILVAGGGLTTLDIPVTRYLPELIKEGNVDPLKNVRWEDVTVGALASQQGGSGQFLSRSLTCLPSPNDTCIPDFLDLMREIVPVQPVFHSALYSDGGFGVLGRVLERMTGLPYNEAINSVLGEPLGLNHTTSFEPSLEDLNAVLIPGSLPVSAWGYDNQVTAPSGGLYSNAADFRTLGLSIFNSKLLSPPTIRSWMKPRAHTSSLTISIGAPWEIHRLTIPVTPSSNRTRISDIYTKGGGQPGYTAIFALSPDHDIGFSVLVAGQGALGDRWGLRAAAGEVFVAAAEHAGWGNAKRNFAGTFSDEAGSNLTITVEGDRPAIGIKSFFSDGVPVLPNLLTPGFEVPGGYEMAVRAYPSGLESAGGKVVKYRAVAELNPFLPRSQAEGGAGLFEDGCISWFSAGFWQTEGGQALDELLFEIEDGKLVSVNSPALGKELKRV